MSGQRHRETAQKDRVISVSPPSKVREGMLEAPCLYKNGNTKAVRKIGNTAVTSSVYLLTNRVVTPCP